MKIQFSKYHGTGNDFILIDNRKEIINLSQQQISFICHRKYGIGADGLIILQTSDKYDFKMKYYNSDGNEGTMCGNGGRCIVAFACHLKIPANVSKFIAIDGVHEYDVLKVEHDLLNIKVKLSDVNKIEKNNDYYFLNTGSPHYVKFVNNINKLDVYTEGKKIRWDEKFRPEGTNVNFVEIYESKIDVRTFERGVENITLSCGTGVTAAAIATSYKSDLPAITVRVSTLGGELKVHFRKKDISFHDIWLEGPVKMVFYGEFFIK